MFYIFLEYNKLFKGMQMNILIDRVNAKNLFILIKSLIKYCLSLNNLYHHLLNVPSGIPPQYPYPI